MLGVDAEFGWGQPLAHNLVSFHPLLHSTVLSVYIHEGLCVVVGWLCYDAKASGLLASPVLPDLQGAVTESGTLLSEACVSAAAVAVGTQQKGLEVEGAAIYVE